MQPSSLYACFGRGHHRSRGDTDFSQEGIQGVEDKLSRRPHCIAAFEGDTISRGFGHRRDKCCQNGVEDKFSR